MSALGQKLPRPSRHLVSALPPKAAAALADRRVRFGPQANITRIYRSRMRYEHKAKAWNSLAEKTQEWLGNRLHGLAALQQLRSLRRRHRPAEQIALHFGAAFFLECLELLFGLDTFGSRLHAKADAHGCDGT